MFDWLKTSKTAYDFGFELGQKGRESVQTDLVKSQLWLQIISDKNTSIVARLAQNTKHQFPEIYKEIEGLADGLALPFEHVFAWNCRGDLITNTPDGCTSVQIPGDKIIIAHNEDGLPFFDGKCFITERTDDNGFISFCYPGSIPGHSFAMTKSGIVMATNNLRLSNFDPQIPRMVLTRELLNYTTLDQARTLLSNAASSGGFHFSLAQMGNPRLISLEFGAGNYSDIEIEQPSVHTNHVLINEKHSAQVITQSSFDRQQRGTNLINANQPEPLELLRDKCSEGLPIWRRDVDDPDEENTLATVVFEVSTNKVDWTFYAGDSKEILYKGTKF